MSIWILRLAIIVTISLIGLIAQYRHARGATIVSTVGDRDGFNGVYNPDTQPLPFRFEFLEYVPDNSGAEPPLMDRVYFGENQNPTWTALFTLPAGFVITAAQFEIVTFDNDSQATGSPASNSGTILLDGNELMRGPNLDQDFFYDAIGETYDGADYTYTDGAAELFVGAIPSSMWPLLSDGQVVVTYTGETFENVGVDYLRISIEGFVPEPSSMALWGAGAVALLIALRRGKRNGAGR